MGCPVRTRDLLLTHVGSSVVGLVIRNELKQDQLQESADWFFPFYLFSLKDTQYLYTRQNTRSFRITDSHMQFLFSKMTAHVNLTISINQSAKFDSLSCKSILFGLIKARFKSVFILVMTIYI